MNTTQKRNYQEPEIKLIKLDNEISLQLESDSDLPPSFEGMQNTTTPEFLTTDPYKGNRV